MKKLLVPFLVLLLGVTVYGQQKIQLRSADKAECVSSDMKTMKASFSFSGIEAEDVTNDRGTYSWLTMANTVLGGNVGEPQLPVVNQLIAVPFGATPRIEITSYSSTDYRLEDYGMKTLVPRQLPVRKDQNLDEAPFILNESAYQTRGLRSEPQAVVSVDGTMRGVQLGTMTIEPVSYDPVNNTVRVFNDIEVEVHFDGADAQATEDMLLRTYSPAFESVYDQLFNNRAITDVYDQHPDFYNTPVKMLVICYSGFKNNSSLNSWLQWKLQKGYYVDIYYTDETGTTASAIASFIKTKYNASVSAGNAYTYLIVIGDTGQVPQYMNKNIDSDIGNCASDLGYASVNFSSSTSNYFPDMYYSRISVENTTHLSNYINKVLTYEKYEFTDGGNFLNNVILVGGWDSSWTSRVAKPTINYATNNYFKSSNTTYGGFENGTISATISTSSTAGWSGTNNGCYNGLNNGVCFLNYTAHGDKQEWYQPKMTAAHVATMTNTGKYFFGVGNCCLTGNFNNTTTTYSPGSSIGTNACFAETMIRVPNAGAIAYVGCSPYSYWYEDFYWAVGAHSYSQGNAPSVSGSSKGVYDVMFMDQYWNSASALLYLGNLAVQQAVTNGNTNSSVTDGNCNNSAHYYFQFYHCFGDGSVMPYVTKPETNTVTIPSTVVPGTSSITVNALAGSYVAVTDNSSVIYGVAEANSSGVATVNFTNAIPASGTLYVVVTRQQYQPWFGTITIQGGTTYTITANVSPTDGGTVTGAGVYGENTQCTLVATAATGYTFSKWTNSNGTTVSTNASYSFTVTGNATYTAVFTKNSYAVTATANPTAGGTVSGAGTYTHGASCTLVATAATGYTFSKWTKNGTTVSTNASYTFTVTEAASYVAVFTIKSYTVTASANPAESGTVTVGSAKGNRDDLVYDFEDGWQGWTTFQGSTTSSHSWMHNTEYTAYDSNGNQIVPECHNSSSGMMLSESYISAATSGGSGTAVTPDNYLVSPQIRLGGSITFYAASRMSNYCAEKFSVLVSESGNTSASHFTHTELTVTLTSNSWNEYTVDLSAYSGMGYVAIRHYDCYDQHLLYVDDVTIVEGDDPSFGSGNFNHGATCVVTATPVGDYQFVNWTENGSVVSTDASYTFTVTGNRDLVANFTQQTVTSYTVTATANPTAGGTITGAGTYTEGETCTLTATAATGYTFTKWTKNGTQVSTNASISFTVNEAAAYVAHFTLNSYNITATASPSAYGQVSGGGTYNHGTTCTLTATPNTGYTFVNWTLNGSVVSTSATYQFQVSGAAAYVANFEVMGYSVTATANPVAGGTMTGTGSTYTYGSTCTLTATPAEGYHFINWTQNGTEVGTGLTYQFTVTGDAAFVANFGIDSYAVTATANPTAGGTVTGSGTYTHGSSCTLTATANTGYTFINWTKNGSVVSTNASYTFNVTAAGSYVAHFEVMATHSVTVNQTTGGTISATPTTGYAGDIITLTVSTESGYFFVDWDVKDANNQTITVTDNQFTMPNSDVTVTATFSQGFVITVAEVEHGVITASQTTAQPGDVITLTATPDEECIFSTWYVFKTGDTRAVLTVVNNQFTMPAFDVTVMAVFKPTEIEDVTVGSGTSTNKYLPTFAYYKYSLSQQIYTAEEVGTAGTITAIAFKVSNSKSTSRNLSIYLRPTNKTAFSSTTDWETMGNDFKVFEGSVNFSASGWTTITLQTPFQYDGVKNLNLCVVDKTGSYVSSQNNAPQFYVYSTGANRAMYVYSDNTQYTVGYSSTIAGYTGTQSTSNDQVTFTMTVPGSSESLSLTPNTVNGLSYMEGSGPSITRKIDIVGVDLSGDISLTAPQGFEICATPNGDFGSTLSIPRETAKSRTVTSWDFEGSFLNWTTIDADGDGHNWMVSTDLMSSYTNGHSGSNALSSESYDKTNTTALTPDNWVVSPQVTLGGTFTMWACAQDASWAAEHFGIFVSTTSNTNTGSFTLLNEWTLSAKGGAKGGHGTRGNRDSGDWYQFSVDLSAYAGQTGYIAVRHFNCSDKFYINVDDFELDTEAGFTPELPVVITPASVYVRLADGLNAGTHSGTLTASVSTITSNVSLNGQVTLPTQTLSLVEGWNWWTPMLQASLGDLEAALDNNFVAIMPAATQVLEPGKMYKIQVSNNCENVSISGHRPASVTVTIANGLNTFGYTGTDEALIGEALNGLNPEEGDMINSFDEGFAIYNGQAWEGTLTTLRPGHAYEYLSKAGGDKTVTF